MDERVWKWNAMGEDNYKLEKKIKTKGGLPFTFTKFFDVDNGMYRIV